MALFLDFVIDAVVERVHVDDAINQRLFFTHRIFHSRNLGRTRGDVEYADLVVLQFHFLLDFAADIHGRDVDGSPQWDEVFRETWEFYLNQAHV